MRVSAVPTVEGSCFGAGKSLDFALLLAENLVSEEKLAEVKKGMEI